MYKSPIDVSFTQYINDVVTAEENAVVSAVVKCGINVDKDELVKALRYDRDQYIQGYTDAEPKWIPCSERLPNDDEDYLVTDGESMAVGYYRTDAKAWDNVNFGWLEYRVEMDGIKKVIAWMPLPKPYEVEE